MLVQPSTPPGTLELLPRDQIVFQHMLDVIRRGYERFGFVPIETPVFELKDVLLTKSGGETEKQVYFVQSTGALQQGHEADLALRFDLTVPLARYVAEHERDLAFPFRRYQIQRVYRGERAQRGRFREFYQCDIDVIGKDKLDPAFDAEIPAIIVQIFEELKIGDFTIHFSNRKILRGVIDHYAGINGLNVDPVMILREIDKIDKIGEDKVKSNLQENGVSEMVANHLLELVNLKDSKDNALAKLKDSTIAHPEFLQGVQELEQVVQALRALGVPEHRTCLNLAIARGLDYYTGTVYETLIDAHPEFGSVCSGGRYDDLASHYTKSKLPGVGISIGLTRLFDQLNTCIDPLTQKNLLEQVRKCVPNLVQILVTQMDAGLGEEYLALATDLRRVGFNVENYLEPAKLDKQLKYADKASIPIVLLMGSNEHTKNTVKVKQMAEKIETEIPRGELVAQLRGMLA